MSMLSVLALLMAPLAKAAAPNQDKQRIAALEREVARLEGVNAAWAQSWSQREESITRSMAALHRQIDSQREAARFWSDLYHARPGEAVQAPLAQQNLFSQYAQAAQNQLQQARYQAYPALRQGLQDRQFYGTLSDCTCVPDRAQGLLGG